MTGWVTTSRRSRRRKPASCATACRRYSARAMCRRRSRLRGRICAAELYCAGHDFDYRWLCRTASWSWQGRTASLPSLPAPGLRRRVSDCDNAAAVLALLEAAGLRRRCGREMVKPGLPDVTLAGRMQLVNARRAALVAGCRAQSGRRQCSRRRRWRRCRIQAQTWAIIGMLDDKDVEGIARPLDAVVDHWIAVTADSPRASAADELARRIANAATAVQNR